MVVMDSSFLVAFFNRTDTHHERALAAMRRLRMGEWGTALLLEYVFLEVVTVLAARGDHAVATRIGERLLRNREIEFVPCSDLFVPAFDAFCRHARLSFVDAAIVTLAEIRQATVLTIDSDFAALGTLEVVS